MGEIFKILFCLCIGLNLHGQYSSKAAIRYSVDDGLPSSTCYDVAQDSKGYIWIATEGGLAKFNGISFEHFGIKDGLIDNEVVRIIIDDQDRIWLNSAGPVTYLQDGKLKVLKTEMNLNLDMNFDVHTTSENLIWLSHKEQLRLFSTKTQKEVPLPNTFENLIGHKKIIGVLNDTVWVSGDKQVYKLFDGEVLDTYNFKRIQNSNKIKPICAELDWPYIIFNNDTGIISYNILTREEKQIYKDDALIKQIILRDNKIYVLNRSKLYILNSNEKYEYIDHIELLDSIITSLIYIDKDGNIWVAAYKDGLYFIPKTNQNIINFDCSEFGSNHIESILLEDGNLLAGTDNNKLIRIEDDLMTAETLNLPVRSEINRVLDIIKIKKNDYLLSTDAGIAHLENDKLTHVVQTSSKRLFVNDSLFVSTNYNRAYYGKLEAILDANQHAPLTQIKTKFGMKPLNSNRTYSVICDSQGSFWIGDIVLGLTKINNTDTTYFKDFSKIFNASITRILEIDDNQIAISTNGEGVIIIKGDEIFQIDSKNGLSSNICYNLSYKHKTLFASTNRGLTIIENFDFEKKSFDSKVYTKDDGLPTNEILDADFDGHKLALATNAGISIIKTKSTTSTTNDISDPVLIESIEVNTEKIPIIENTVFQSNENNIRIRYVSPTYKKSKKKYYSYKLEGVDSDWIKTDALETHYSNLPPGNYKFNVKQDKSSKTTSYAFEIKPQFTQTLLFKWLLALASLIFLFAFLIFNINNRQRKKFKTLFENRTKELKDNLKALGVANKKLQTSNQEIEQFAYIASHDLQEPLNTISGFSKILGKKYQDSEEEEYKNFTSMIIQSSERMKELIQDILKYSKIGTNKNKVSVNLNLLLKEIVNDLSSKILATGTIIQYENLPTIIGYKLELRLLFQNLITNAIKFQKKDSIPHIKILYKEEKNKFTFEVIDNGIGIKKEYQEQIFNIFQRLHNKSEYKGTGIGLAHCKKIVDLHDGTIWVKSIFGKGSNFKFTISKNIT